MMNAIDQAELHKIAQQVEISRERLQSMEQQIQRLDEVRLEQIRTINTLKSIPKHGSEGIMIPLGSGVQILANISENAGVVIDIGSRVQAEKTREEAIIILTNRNDELNNILQKLKSEYEVLEQYIVSLAHQFTSGVEQIQENKLETPISNEILAETKQIPTKNKRRKRGRELTLDD